MKLSLVTVTVLALVLSSVGEVLAGKSGGTSKSYGGKSYSSPSRDHSVKGHVRRDGAYVPPHRATNPNSNKRDNYSSKGNVNPYTGKPGTVDPDK